MDVQCTLRVADFAVKDLGFAVGRMGEHNRRQQPASHTS